jgi:hypothetical protein
MDHHPKAEQFRLQQPQHPMLPKASHCHLFLLPQQELVPELELVQERPPVVVAQEVPEAVYKQALHILVLVQAEL